ncbi:MAG: four-carbon acid sugar kinase family protein [Acidocella sp.]|nr:four-carbon acid sugar kinase family protein [Acidocella sp.]
MKRAALAVTLADAAVLAVRWGAGCCIGRGSVPEPGYDASILAPSGRALSSAETVAALQQRADGYFLSLGNQEAAPEIDDLVEILEPMIESAGFGFMAACFANPALGRTMYQGHLFQDGRLLMNVPQVLARRLSGRVMAIGYDIIAAGPAAIRARLVAAREQNVALALLDATSLAHTAMIAEALAGQILIGGAAWMAGDGPDTAEPEAPTGKLAILSGAQDRQTLFQLAIAREAVAFHQIDPARGDAVETAVTWAAQQVGAFIISASARPGLAQPAPSGVGLLPDIAEGLAALGVRRFVITGADTAAMIMDRLGATQLLAGAAEGGMRWLQAGDYNLLLKPGGFGARHLLADGFEPQIRRNDAAE